MTATLSPPQCSSAATMVSPAIIDSVTTALDRTSSAFFATPPLRETNCEHADEPCVAGIISFVGDQSFTFSWIMSKDTAVDIARRFAGFDVQFESPDMGDLAGELVNVLAGEIIAQLERRQLKSAMSLPTVARGNPLELVPEIGPSIANIGYRTPAGRFWFRLAAAKSQRFDHK
jgi:CheY-specific phosphatase CheX